MRNLKFFAFLIAAITFFSIKLIAQPQGQWTWMNGLSSSNGLANYGLPGVFAPGVTPPATYEPCQATDSIGNFWIFGGLSYFNNSIQYYGDLWEFSPTLNLWAWAAGPGSTDQPGVYGTQGIASILNMPGCRSYCAAAWTDNNHNLWIFGGTGYDVNGNVGNLNDLWKYDMFTQEWTWMKGPDTWNNNGVYGTKGVPAPNNNPPSREESDATWVDSNNNLWLFGGLSITGGTYSDLWEFNTTTNEWTWINGPNTTGNAPIWGAKGVESAFNHPGGRLVYSKWKDNSGNFWLFGGNDLTNSYNDLWRYRPTTNKWTWMSGTNNPGDTGHTGTQCVPDVNNCPSARFETRSTWTRDCQNFLVFGGTSDLSGLTMYNDLWNYNVFSNAWTLMSGSPQPNQAGSYGALGVSSPLNIPGSRFGGVGWTDTLGRIWLFGGSTQFGFLYKNDMWRYVIDTLCPVVNYPARADFTLAPDSGCLPFNVILTNLSTNDGTSHWNFGDGTIDTVTNSPNHIYSVAGVDTVTLVVENFGYCGVGFDSMKMPVTIFPSPTVNLGPDRPICDTIHGIILDAGNFGDRFLWSDGDTTEFTIVHDTGAYWVIVTQNNCSASDTINITPAASPKDSLGPDQKLCYGQSVVLDAHNVGATYLWNTGANTETITAATTGNYIVEIDFFGCVAIDTVNINIRPQINVNLGPDTFICPGDQMVIDAGAGYLTYNWIPGGQTTRYLVITQPGTYGLTVTDSNGCVARTSIWIDDFCPSDLYIPNAFTPTGNGINDYFLAYCENIQEFQMIIYDRWGQKLFESDDITTGWDGTFMGKQCPQGTYVYVVNYKLFDYKELQMHTKVGKVTLIR